eukprot:gene6727-6434_t
MMVGVIASCGKDNKTGTRVAYASRLVGVYDLDAKESLWSSTVPHDRAVHTGCRDVCWAGCPRDCMLNAPCQLLGMRILVAAVGGNLMSWSPNSTMIVAANPSSYKVHPARASALLLLPDLTPGLAKLLPFNMRNQIVSAANGDILLTSPGDWDLGNEVRAVAWSPDAAMIAVAGDQKPGILNITDAATGESGRAAHLPKVIKTLWNATAPPQAGVWDEKGNYPMVV